MYLPYLECISVNILYLSRMIRANIGARLSYKKSLQSCMTTCTRQHHTKQNTTSPLSPTGRLWDHPPLRGRSRRSHPITSPNVTTISHREIVGPPLLKGAVTTFASTAKTNPPNPNTTSIEQIRGVGSHAKGGRRSQIQTTSPTIPQTPLLFHPPSRKRGSRCGFLRKGGLVCVLTTCRPVRTPWGLTTR